MSAPQFKKRQHAYVQCRSWTDISKQNARYSRGLAQEGYDKEIAGAQEIDGIIENTGESLARILGVARIIEKPDASRWLHTRKMEEAIARAVCSFMEHSRTLHVNDRLIGDLFSPYTSRVGVGWGELADVQQIADAFQGVLEEHNYGVASTRKRPAPRRVVVLDEAHSLYAPISEYRGNLHNISVLVLRADMVTDDVATLLQRDLNAGVGHA